MIYNFEIAVETTDERKHNEVVLTDTATLCQKTINIYDKNSKELLDFFEVDINANVDDLNEYKVIDKLVGMLMSIVGNVHKAECLEYDIREYLDWWPLTPAQDSYVCVDTDEYLDIHDMSNEQLAKICRSQDTWDTREIDEIVRRAGLVRNEDEEGDDYVIRCAESLGVDITWEGE